MTQYNDIGISRQLDWPRIKKLLTIGLVASLLWTAGSFYLGWGKEEEGLFGLPRMLSACQNRSDRTLIAIALIGMVSLTLVGLSSFGVYRLIAAVSPAYAHKYRTGLLGMMIFGGCGFHLPLCALIYLARHLGWTEVTQGFHEGFFAPGTGLFFLSFCYMQLTQAKAFSKGLTPCPRGCWVCTPLLPMVFIQFLRLLGNYPWINALSFAWMGVGFVWMFAGLLAVVRKTAASHAKKAQ